MTAPNRHKPADFLMRGLLRAYFWCDESLQNQLRAAGWQTVSRTQSMIMVNVADGITRPIDLARVLGVSRQAIQQLLADMEQHGLVHLVTDPQDARAKIVRFSSRGRGVGQAAYAALDQIEAELNNRLGPQLLAQLRRALFERDWGPVLNPPAVRPSHGKQRRPLPKTVTPP